MEDQYLNIEEAASHLGISPQELRELRNRGEITGVPDAGDWKFKVDDVNELARSRDPAAVPFSADIVESADAPEAAPTVVSTPQSDVPPKTASEVLKLRQELLAQSSPITSRLIIDHLATVCGVNGDNAEKVVDGFWNDLVDLAHYRDGRLLVIPHFGTFSLSRNGDQTALAFKSKTVESIQSRLKQRQRTTASERWIEFFEKMEDGDVAQLSVKRQMSVRIATKSNCDLHLVHRVLSELFDILCEVFASADKKVRWAMRGEMAPASWRDETWYALRCYQRLSAQLPGWKETQAVTGRGTAPASPGKQGRKKSPSKASRGSRSQGKAETGCLASVLAIVIAFAVTLIVVIV
ncbi:MAG: helix-turn-helix domain-containing protein [Planctomycetaceae bacterium]|jgi:hypothetical protein|nr:helix-turn-helix domain-containing protein [Planctomycetaceae bacterium]MBT6153728.1 helix-turn-helix domain-containing protein [Planctomycetaceae bacterium]MBT6485531.1 helix-turn-helix domain-containing protein [Planctomycetaceae bacterium]MBT6494409.1 helix-turn-helix domain-containing protein [Planctomycetaceae bacterium]